MDRFLDVEELKEAIFNNLTGEHLSLPGYSRTTYTGVANNMGWFSYVTASQSDISLSIPITQHLSFDGRRLFDRPMISIYMDRVFDVLLTRNRWSTDDAPCVIFLVTADLREALLNVRRGLLRTKKVFDDCQLVQHEEMSSPTITGWAMDNAYVYQAKPGYGMMSVSTLISKIRLFAMEITSSMLSAGFCLEDLKGPSISRGDSDRISERGAGFVGDSRNTPSSGNRPIPSTGSNPQSLPSPDIFFQAINKELQTPAFLRENWFTDVETEERIIALCPPRDSIITFENVDVSESLYIFIDCKDLSEHRPKCPPIHFCGYREGRTALETVKDRLIQYFNDNPFVLPWLVQGKDSIGWSFRIDLLVAARARRDGGATIAQLIPGFARAITNGLKSVGFSFAHR